MSNNAALSASLEDNLEVIFHLLKEKTAARPKDISKRLKVNSSSTTGALRSLSKKGLINYAPYEIVTLTPKGSEIARRLVRRHQMLRKFFIEVLNVTEKEADEVACKMEHVISRGFLDKLVRCIGLFDHCPVAGKNWCVKLERYGKDDIDSDICERCLSQCLEDLRKAKHERDDGKNENIGL